MKAAFLTLGCKLNYAETNTYERGFVKAGVEVVPWQQKADLYVVNTCSVTATADTKSRNIVRKMLRINPEAKVIVTGCSAELRREDYESIEGVSLVIGADSKQTLVKRGLALLGIKAESEDSLNAAAGVFGAYSTTERTRSFLKIQDGCDNFCRYCTVPYARGRSRNISIEECVRMAREIASLGVKEIVLTGVNTGDFGKTTGESFLSLLQALEGVEGIERYRISSIEPNLITEDIVDWIASGTKFQPHFHIPLQAGTDEILKAMGRRYDTAFFRDRIEYIRRRLEREGLPKVFFGIDVMVGLPGETPLLFERSKAFIESIRPAFIHVFPYSRRPGTPAASMSGQVDEREKVRRVAILEELSSRLHDEFVESNRGIRERVLFESKEKDGSMSGYTGNYIRITRPYDETLVGKLTDITI